MMLSNSGYFQKFQTRCIIASTIIAAVVLLSCCNKEDELSESKPEKWSYLVDTSDLGIVASTTVKLTMKLAGYDQFSKYVKHSIRVYRISYYTTYKGSRIKVSGIISYPYLKKDSIPIMVVANGLIFADEDAPSNFNLPSNYTGFEFIASLGYLTLIPDMIGFGDSKDILFPISNYEHSSQTMIDGIFACQEFIRSKMIKVSNKQFLTGYSQGGHIALSTLKKIEETPIPGLDFTAAAIGAGGFNLVSLLDYAISNNTYSAPSHMAMLFATYNIMYDWHKDLTYFFQEPYAGKILDLIGGAYNREEIDLHLTTNFDSLLNQEFFDNLKNGKEPELRSALAANSVYNWAPKTTLRIIHSTNDDRIPVEDSEDTYKTMLANGSKNVSFSTIETKGHYNSGIEFIEVVLNWFEEF